MKIRAVRQRTEFERTLVLGALLVAAVGARAGEGVTTTQLTAGAAGAGQQPGVILGVDRGGITRGVIDTLTERALSVNGSSYGLSGARISVNDQRGDATDLDAGQVVTVRVLAGGVGIEVAFDPEVIGTIEGIDAGGDRIEVLGQTVWVDAGTVYDAAIDPPALSGLAAGDAVQVSGILNAEGDILARHVGPAAGTTLEVKGFVDELDPAAARMEIRDLIVDYGAALLHGFDGGLPEEGDYVEARGLLLGTDGELLAEVIELEDLLPGAVPGTAAELEGLITAVWPDGEFEMGAQRVVVTAQTRFENGTVTDILPNRDVHVSGVVNAANAIEAARIEFEDTEGDEDESPLVLGAPLTYASAEEGLIRVLGLAIVVDASTSLEDRSQAGLSNLALEDLVAGDWVEVRVVEDPNGLQATRVERIDAGPRLFAEGEVTALQGGRQTLSISGIAVRAVAHDDHMDEFFARVSLGARVRVEGIQLSHRRIGATELELENQPEQAP